jgi:hypothetical protein
MDVATRSGLSILDEVKIQAGVLLPLIGVLRLELGAERADALLRTALRDWSRRIVDELAGQIAGTRREKWDTLTAARMPRIGTDIDVEMLRHEADALEFNVTGCRYADFFRQLGEPELGELLLCARDFDVAAIGHPEVGLTRAQTIMRGAPCCDFRYHMI